MDLFFEEMVSRHRTTGILVDSNLLLLLLAGLCDRSLVTKLKRLNAYRVEDLIYSLIFVDYLSVQLQRLTS
jgi:hypothetical protein